MRRIVGIEATPACRRFNGEIGRHQHDDRIEHRMTVADPGQRLRRASGDEHAFAGALQVAHEIVDGGRRFVVLPQHQHRRGLRDRGARAVPQLGRAVSKGRDPQDFGNLERDLADAAEAVSASDDKRHRRTGRAAGPGRPVAAERTCEPPRQIAKPVGADRRRAPAPRQAGRLRSSTARRSWSQRPRVRRRRRSAEPTRTRPLQASVRH